MLTELTVIIPNETKRRTNIQNKVSLNYERIF